MIYRVIFLTAFLTMGLSRFAFGQPKPQDNFTVSVEPKGKSDSILIEDFVLKTCNNGVLLIGYRLGSGKRLKAITFNKKKYTKFFLDTIKYKGHRQGILAIPLGKIEKTIHSDINILLDGAAGVRGAVAIGYDNVNQLKPFNILKKNIPDTTNAINVTITNTKKRDVIFDLLSGKCKKQRNITATVGKEQTLLTQPRNIRPNPSKKSGLLIMASSTSTKKKKLLLKWSLEKELINLFYHAIVLQAVKNSN